MDTRPTSVGHMFAVEVGPDFGAVGASGSLSAIAGTLLTVVMVVSVLMLVVCAIGWAVGTSTGSYQAAARSRTGLWVSLGAAALAGAGVVWLNFLLDLGSGL